MNAVFKRISLIVIFAAISLLLAACGNTVTSQKGPVHDPQSEPGATDAPAASKKGFEYPKIASSVATAEIKGLDGGVYTLNEKQGKIMLLNLWATWCGPCRSEIPALVRMQEKHGEKGFEVLGLNTDDEEIQLINNFGTELKINYPIAYANTHLQSSLLKISKFPGIPQSFLIDRDGRLRGVFRGANPADIAKMEEVVAKVVNESGDVPPVLREAPEVQPNPPSPDSDTPPQPSGKVDKKDK